MALSLRYPRVIVVVFSLWLSNYVHAFITTVFQRWCGALDHVSRRLNGFPKLRTIFLNSSSSDHSTSLPNMSAWHIFRATSIVSCRFRICFRKLNSSLACLLLLFARCFVSNCWKYEHVSYRHSRENISGLRSHWNVNYQWPLCYL